MANSLTVCFLTVTPDLYSTILDYADSIWGNRGNVALIEQLQVLQNKAAHIL